MKRVLLLMVVVLLVGTMIGFYPSALAEAVTGTTNGSTSFRVKANKNGYITLTSSQGTAMVAQHNWLGIYQQDGKERHYGFYWVTARQDNGANNFSLIWAPSATTNKDDVSTCIQAELRFPETGTYTITISPLSNTQAARYWKVDYIKYWIDPAQWVVSVEHDCMAYIPKTSDQVRVHDNYHVTVMRYGKIEEQIQSYDRTVTIREGQYIQQGHPSADNRYYICLSNPIYVDFDSIHGASTHDVYYEYVEKNTYNYLKDLYEKILNNNVTVTYYPAASVRQKDFETFALEYLASPSEPTMADTPTTKKITGDVNNDSVVDGRDLLRLARYIAGTSVKIDDMTADINGDGNVDGRDVLRLAKQLAGS